jgi:formate/nitrite transporter FocA (FNT family)
LDPSFNHIYSDKDCTKTQAVGDVFSGNVVAGVFVISLLLSLLLPKEKKEEA